MEEKHEPPAFEDAPARPAAGPQTALVLHLVDERGVAIAEREFSVELFQPSLQRTSIRRTDRAGALSIDLRRLGNELGAKELALQVIALNEHPARGARVGLEGRIDPGTNDLGIVVVAVPPLIVAGVVQNPAAIPVPKAEVIVTPYLEDAGGTRRWFDIINATTGADGRFEARGFTSATGAMLSVHHRAAVPIPPLYVPAGTQGITITLVGGGAIEGRVLLDAGVPQKLVTAFTVSADGFEYDSERVHPEVDGQVLLAHLLPGQHTLTVHSEGDGVPLLSLTGLPVENGMRLRPPELNPLDLRGRVRAVEVQVTGVDGAPCDAAVYYRESGAAVDWVVSQHQRGVPTVLFTTAAALDISAGLTGHGSAEAIDVTASSVTLVLGGAYDVRLRLTGPFELPHGVKLQARLMPRDGLDETPDERPALGSGKAFFDADGQCLLRPTRPGRHRVSLWLVRGRSSGLELPAPPDVEVAAVAGSQVLLIDPPLFGDSAQRLLLETQAAR